MSLGRALGLGNPGWEPQGHCASEEGSAQAGRAEPGSSPHPGDLGGVEAGSGEEKRRVARTLLVISGIGFEWGPHR